MGHFSLDEGMHACTILDDLYLVSDVFEVTSECKFPEPVKRKTRDTV